MKKINWFFWWKQSQINQDSEMRFIDCCIFRQILRYHNFTKLYKERPWRAISYPLAIHQDIGSTRWYLDITYSASSFILRTLNKNTKIKISEHYLKLQYRSSPFLSLLGIHSTAILFQRPHCSILIPSLMMPLNS